MLTGEKHRILVVDDESENIAYLVRALGRRFEVLSALSGDEGLRILEHNRVAVILSDHRMPGMSGVEFLTRSIDLAPEAMRLVVTGYADLDATIHAINKSRVSGFIKKPVGPQELVQAVENAVELYTLRRRNEALIAELEARNAELLDKERLLELSLDEKSRELLRINKQLEQLVIRDSLTGLYNHRYFQERTEEEVKRAQRYDLELSLVFCDIDNFKLYNDSNGHPSGDAALVDVARILISGQMADAGFTRVRETDIVARYGGEEFVVLLPETPKAGARIVAERLRKAVESYEFPGAKALPGGKLTISLGIASFPIDASSRGSLIERADQALYKAKSTGKNRVVLYEG